MAGWELIESAGDTEKSGGDLLVVTVPGGRRQVAHFVRDPAPGAWIGDDGKPLTPSHYQELPEAPKAATPEERAKAKAAADAKVADAKAKAAKADAAASAKKDA